MPEPRWRVGNKVPINVYEDDIPQFQCHLPEDAARIVSLLNRETELAEENLRLRQALEEIRCKQRAAEALNQVLYSRAISVIGCERRYEDNGDANG
jgi:hypothetical protein